MSAPSDRDPSPKQAFRSYRVIPLALLALIAITVIASGWYRELSLETLMRHRAMVDDFIVGHRAAAVAAYLLLYLSVVALSIPGGTILTISGGLLFGTLLGGVLAIIGATSGAIIAFLVAKTAIGELIARRAGSLAHKLAQRFRQNAFTFLLFLRLVPLFPFWLVNLVPALCGVRLATFVAATVIGIVPATFAFAFFGAGLDSAMAAEAAAFNACVSAGHSGCMLHFDLRAAATPQLIAALFALGILALTPIAVRRFKRARGIGPGN